MQIKKTTARKKRTFLATTALHEFWDKTQPILFIDEWCKTHKNRCEWESLDSETITSSLCDEDPDDICQYVDQIYNALLPIIAKWLNKIHAVSYSVEYWEIIIGSFLFIHIQTVYDRCRRLNKALQYSSELTTFGLEEELYKTPVDSKEYYYSSLCNDLWNLQLFTQLISLFFKNKIHIKDCFFVSQENEKKVVHANNKNKYRLKTRIYINVLWFWMKWIGPKAVGIGVITNFKKRKLIQIIISSAFRVIPILPRNIVLDEVTPLDETKPNFLLRNEISSLPTSDDFSKIVLNTLVVNMPISFIENYKKIDESSKKKYPFFIKTVIGFSIVTDEALKIWAARNKENGLIRVGMQHGGGYGAWKSCGNEFLEHKVCDKFIAWGLKTEGKVIGSPVISIAQLIEEQKYNKNVTTSDEILWIATEFTRYPSEVKEAAASTYCNKSYYDQQIQLLSLLNVTVFSKVTMRPRHTDFSDRWKFLLEKFPTLRVEKPTEKISFYEKIARSKLLIIDNLNTTQLYGLALNIPTILFCSDDFWTTRDDVAPYFDALKEAGIYHTAIESAAHMINLVADDPALWWNSEKVQRARRNYCDYFTQVSSNWLYEWKNILKNL